MPGYAISNRFIGLVSDFSISILILIIFLLCLKKFIEKNNLNTNLVISIIVYIALIALFMLYYSSKTGIFDGHGIYNVAGPDYYKQFNPNSFNLKAYTGSDFLSFILRPLVNYLNLSFYSVTFIFFYFGTFGVLLCLKLYQNLNLKSNFLKIFILAFCFNPSLNIFTSGIMKDTLIFFVTMLLLYLYFIKKYDLKYFSLISILPLLFIYFIRPYLGGIIIFSIFTYFVLFSINLKIKNLIVLIILSLIVGLTFLTSINLYAWNYDGGLIEQIVNFVKTRQYSTNVGNTIMGYTNSEFFYRFFQSIFGFGVYKGGLFGPVFLYDQILSFYLFSLFLFLKLKTFKNLKNFYFKDYELLRLFIIYSIGLYLICSISISNFGLILRLKWMYWPIITFFIISLFQTNAKKI